MPQPPEAVDVRESARTSQGRTGGQTVSERVGGSLACPPLTLSGRRRVGRLGTALGLPRRSWKAGGSCRRTPAWLGRAAFERRCITSNIVALRSSMAPICSLIAPVGRAPHRSRCDTDFCHGLLAPKRSMAWRRKARGELRSTFSLASSMASRYRSRSRLRSRRIAPPVVTLTGYRKNRERVRSRESPRDGREQHQHRYTSWMVLVSGGTLGEAPRKLGDKAQWRNEARGHQPDRLGG